MARKALYPPSVKVGIPREQALPPGWTRVRFGDVLEVVERPIKLEDENEYQLVTAKRNRGGVVPRERLSGKKILTKTQFVTRSGDFLISRRQIIHGACGIVTEALDGAVVSNEYATLRPKSILDAEFLQYLSHSTHFQQCCFHSSVGVDVEKMVFKLEDWLKHSIILPPIEEQCQIAAILKCLDEAIQATANLIEQSRILDQALLRHVLKHGLGHKQFQLSENREIPKGWTTRRISQVGMVQAGRQRSPHFVDGKVRPYLRVANVLDNEISFEDVLEMAFTDSEFERYSLAPGDILLNEGQSIGLVGRCAMFNGPRDTYAFQNTLIRFRPGPEILPDFALAVFQDLYISGVFSSIATQTTSIAHLGVSRFAELSIPVPPLAEQEHISKTLVQLGAHRRLEVQKLQALHDLRNGLMSGLLSGTIRSNRTQLVLH